MKNIGAMNLFYNTNFCALKHINTISSKRDELLSNHVL